MKENRETYPIPESPRVDWAGKRLLRTLVVSGPIVGLILLTAACAENRQTINVGDENADGIVNVLDARAVFGEDWRTGLDLNNNLRIDPQDVELVAMRVGTKPASIFNIDGEDGITCDDVAIVERHLGETVEADPEAQRLRDQAYYADRIVIHFKEGTFQRTIDELVEQRGYTKLDQQPLSLLDKIQVIVEIPEEVLAESNLDTQIAEVSQEKGVLSVNKFDTPPIDDIIGKSQPCP